MVVTYMDGWIKIHTMLIKQILTTFYVPGILLVLRVQQSPDSQGSCLKGTSSWVYEPQLPPFSPPGETRLRVSFSVFGMCSQPPLCVEDRVGVWATFPVPPGERIM